MPAIYCSPVIIVSQHVYVESGRDDGPGAVVRVFDRSRFDGHAIAVPMLALCIERVNIFTRSSCQPRALKVSLYAPVREGKATRPSMVNESKKTHASGK